MVDFGCVSSSHISSEGIEVDPKEMEALKNRPRSLTTTDIRSFLGLAGYYRRFVDRFASIASPLTTLTQNKVNFEWLEACERGFQELKDNLTSAPVLTLPRVQRFFLCIVTHDKWVWGVCLCNMGR